MHAYMLHSSMLTAPPIQFPPTAHLSIYWQPLQLLSFVWLYPSEPLGHMTCGDLVQSLESLSLSALLRFFEVMQFFHPITQKHQH